MATLYYGAPVTAISFDDDVLSALFEVIERMLRRGESFMLTWREQVDLGEGVNSVAISAGLSLRFSFSAAGRPPADPQLVEAMERSALADGGLDLTREVG